MNSAIAVAVAVVAHAILLFFAQSVSANGKEEEYGPGTTPHLKSMFVGRCWDYEEVKHKAIASQQKNCDRLWDLFSSSFSYKAQCTVREKDYQPFMLEASQQIAADKIMLWSGTYAISHEYADSGRRYITLEDSLIGYLANGVTWCGQVEAPGMNFEKCPKWGACPYEADRSFWGSASKTFAQSAVGVVTVVLDGSNPLRPAFRSDSFFAEYELPNLRKPEVTSIRVVLIHRLDVPPVETCTTGSLVALRKLVTEHGFVMECIENPKTVMFLMCADDPQSKYCNAIKAVMKGEEHVFKGDTFD